MNVHIFSDHFNKVTLNSPLVDLPKAGIQQQIPTTQATIWRIFRLPNNILKGLCSWAAFQLDPDNVYVFLFIIFDIIKANKKKLGPLADLPLFVLQAWRSVMLCTSSVTGRRPAMKLEMRDQVLHVLD